MISWLSSPFFTKSKNYQILFTFSDYLFSSLTDQTFTVGIAERAVKQAFFRIEVSSVSVIPGHRFRYHHPVRGQLPDQAERKPRHTDGEGNEEKLFQFYLHPLLFVNRRIHQFRILFLLRLLRKCQVSS